MSTPLCVSGSFPNYNYYVGSSDKGCNPGDRQWGSIPGLPNPSAGALGSAAGSAASGAAGAVAGSLLPKSITDKLSSASTWKGIGLMLVAGVLVLVGVVFLVSGSSSGRVATQTGERMAA